MTRKEYILNLENLILNRVKYHAPRITEDYDYALLDAIGIDARFPVFIFDKSLDKVQFEAFKNAKNKAEFNLILTEKPSISLKKINSLNNTFVIFREEMGSLLYRTLEQLNINYLSHSNFKQDIRKEYIKINDKEISFDFLPFYYFKKVMTNNCIIDSKCFLLNGKNYLISFSNTSNAKQNVKFEFNLPLPRGYYTFKKQSSCIEIENLTNKQKAYFNYNFKNAKISFSTMNGIDSCTFACINLECNLQLLPKESRKCYFNFGENKYCFLSPKEMTMFFDISQKKMNEIFDIKVTTRDSNFDDLFNRSLPRNIWEKWQNFDTDEESENSYIKMKNEIVKNEGKGYQISKSFIGLKEVRFFRENRWKRVFIVHNKACYLFADRIKYFNFTLLTKEILDKNDEIYLSFSG